MRPNDLVKIFAPVLLFFFWTAFAFAQTPQGSDAVIVEVVEEDATPGIVQRLPDYPNVRGAHILNTGDLKKSLGERPLLDLVNFEGGTEAAAADYEQGKLLIVEYATPQTSVDADNKFKQRLAENPESAPVFYRRAGNYSVFVFDAKDEVAANSLLDRVKYEKSVQWLGEDPFLIERIKRAEKAYINTTADVFLSTVIAITLGLSTAVLSGVAVGFFVFFLRRQKRTALHSFSDAGGMVRLNLDELTSDVSPNRLLNE